MNTLLLSVDLRNRLIISVGVLLILIGVLGYFLVKQSQHEIIEKHALTVAEIVVKHSSAVRSIYSETVYSPLKTNSIQSANFHAAEKTGSIPLPAQFIKNVAGKASTDSDGLYEYRAVSKWNLAAQTGLNSEFLKSAWKKLEAQDQPTPTQPIDWQPSYKIVNAGGKDTLFFMKADPAVNQSCVTCHNAYEKSPEIIQRRLQQGTEPGKQWEQHQLLGAFFVKIPLSGIQALAISKNTESIIWIVIVLTAGLTILAYLLVGDASKAKENADKLFWQARHDSLTKLPNRVYFEEKTLQLIQQAKETACKHCMCYLDLDQFKIVNDSCGHTAGDQLLREIAIEIQQHLENDELLARLGGDEFGLLFENCSLEEAEQIANKLCQRVKNYHFICGDQFFEIGVSIGLVEINTNTDNVETVFNHSDIACYAAKESGRNRVQIYRENDDEIAMRSDQMAWVPKILAALEEKRLTIFAQKITPLKGKDHTHFEILLRLIDTHGNIIPPNNFLPSAERYGLMGKVDIYVIELAFNALQTKLFKNPGDNGFVSINLSGHSLSDEKFLHNVVTLMDKYTINPRQICFEITETAAVKNPKMVRRFMLALKERHVSFALDDFGTGLSSLTYLKQFPVDYLKIDGSFIKDIVSNTVDRKLVVSINQLAQAMDIKTIAEYVESAEIFDLLKEIGIDYAQGYFVHKPEAVYAI